MLKKILAIVVLGLFIIGMVTLTSCTSSVNKTDSSKKIHIVVSFNAIREFAQAVGKDKVDVATIIPNGTEPHDFELKARDLLQLNQADIFVYNGLDMEAWADKAISIMNNKKLIVVEASKGYKQLNSQTLEATGKYDPHVWLSLTGAEYEAKSIMNALIKVDPANKNYYSRNYNDFYKNLEGLLKTYNKKFSSLKNKNFVTGHAAFAYLCRDFGLKQNSVEGVFAEGEPSIKKLKNLIDYCRASKIKTIFVEDMVSPRVSETLANEVGAKAIKIYTLESKEDNKDYLQSMESNLTKIYDSLK